MPAEAKEIYQLEGVAHRVEVPVWHRGPAHIARVGSTKLVVLEQRRARLYAVTSSQELVFDLERVTDEESVLQFVGKYGLLTEGERMSGAFVGYYVMPLDSFLGIAHHVRTCLSIHRSLKSALDGDPDALAELRKLEHEAREVTGRHGTGVELDPAESDLIKKLKLRAYRNRAARATDAELLSLMALALTFLINIGLTGVEERISASIAWPKPGEGADWPRDAFTLDVHTKTLHGTIFHHLALVVLNRLPLEACERCGSLYFKQDPRQRFCTTLCANRSRKEKFNAKAQSSVKAARAKGGKSSAKTRTR